MIIYWTSSRDSRRRNHWLVVVRRLRIYWIMSQNALHIRHLLELFFTETVFLQFLSVIILHLCILYFHRAHIASMWLLVVSRKVMIEDALWVYWLAKCEASSLIKDDVVFRFFIFLETRIDGIILTFKFRKGIKGSKTICIFSILHLSRECVIIQRVLFGFDVGRIIERLLGGVMPRRDVISYWKSFVFVAKCSDMLTYQVSIVCGIHDLLGLSIQFSDSLSLQTVFIAHQRLWTFSTITRCTLIFIKEVLDNLLWFIHN